MMYCLKHEYRSADKAQTESVLNGIKNDPSYEFISEVILAEINVV